MATASRAKHKFCRRIGSCLWGDVKCPSVERPYAAGAHGKTRRAKLSPYAELLVEKQKLRNYYAISEKQLSIAYAKAKSGGGMTHEKLLKSLERRLDALLFHSGFAPTIFAAKQWVSHGHILVDGKRVDRGSSQLKEGQVISIDASKSPTIAEIAKKATRTAPAYLEVDLENVKATFVRVPLFEEIPIQGSVNVMSVVEYYAR